MPSFPSYTVIFEKKYTNVLKNELDLPRFAFVAQDQLFLLMATMEKFELNESSACISKIIFTFESF